MKITVLFLFVGLSLTATAQKAKSTKTESMLMTRGIGVSFQKFDGLNSRIAVLPQYKALRDYMATLSLGSMNVRNNFISGINITGGSSMSGDKGKRSSSLRFLSGSLYLGYDVIKGDKFMLYPMVGFGGEGYQARFFKDNSAVNFNDVLTSGTTQNNIRPVIFKNMFGTYHAGIGFTVKPSTKSNGSIGIQASYTGSFKDKAWKSSDNQDLGNAPSDRLSRFQVGLVINSFPKFIKK